MGYTHHLGEFGTLLEKQLAHHTKHTSVIRENPFWIL